MADANPKSESRPAAPKRSNSGNHKTGVVIPHTPKWHQRLGAWIVFVALRTLMATVRYKLMDHSAYFGPPPVNENPTKPTKQAIYCLWHNRLASCMKAYHRFGRPRKPANGLAALISASKDGAFLSGILERFKVQPVRGSSSRRGSQGLLEMTTWADRGYDLAITPDGPRGPCYQIQDGIMSLAQLTGLPILPVSFNLTGKISVRSWDRFQIPLPFARCDVRIGQPVFVPREATDAERDVLRLELQKRLAEITRD